MFSRGMGLTPYPHSMDSTVELRQLSGDPESLRDRLAKGLGEQVWGFGGQAVLSGDGRVLYCGLVNQKAGGGGAGLRQHLALVSLLTFDPKT